MRFTLYTSSSQLSYVFFHSLFKRIVRIRFSYVFFSFFFLFDWVPIYSPGNSISKELFAANCSINCCFKFFGCCNGVCCVRFVNPTGMDVDHFVGILSCF